MATRKKADDQERPNEKILKISGKEVKLTNQNKIYWPDEGYTKGDLVEYYDRVSKYILPYLKGRPESLNRFPGGIKGESFYQKDAGDAAPDWVSSIEIYSESNDKVIDYVICDDKATLLYLANLGCIEMNPWNSTVKKLDHPTWLIIDLDPSEGNKFTDVVEAALVTHDILENWKVDHYCKTSGSTGLHVYVPMGAKYDYEQVKNFALLICQHVMAQLPDTTTLERSLSKRDKGKIYLDYLQNRRGQTVASAYSVRPKPGATVSTPLEWNEVTMQMTPQDFNIFNIMERLEKKGDLFARVLGKGIDLKKVLNNI